MCSTYLFIQQVPTSKKFSADKDSRRNIVLEMLNIIVNLRNTHILHTPDVIAVALPSSMLLPM